MGVVGFRVAETPAARSAVVLVVLVVLLLPPMGVWVARKALARWRRPGVVILKHQLTLVDLARSLIFSIKGAKRTEIVGLVLFVLVAVLRRRLPKWIGSTLPFLRNAWARHVIKRRSSWLTLGGALWYAHWRHNICERPAVSCRRTFWNVAIVEKAGLNKREFRPVFWLTSRHAQTVIAHVLADLSFLLIRPVQWRREAVQTHDGGEVYLDWIAAPAAEFEPYGDGLTVSAAAERSRSSESDSRAPLFEAPPESDASSPIILLMYGIGGTRDDHYMKNLALNCRARGWRPVCLSYWRLDWNEWRDVDAAVKTINAAYPLAPLFAVAHSASAYILVQYLAAVGQSTPVVSAVSLSGCLDFLRAYDFVKHTKNRTYRTVFARGMRRCVRRHHAHDPTLDPDERQKRAARLLRIRCGADVMYDRHVASLNRATHLEPRRAPVDAADHLDPAFAHAPSATTAAAAVAKTKPHNTATTQNGSVVSPATAACGSPNGAAPLLSPRRRLNGVLSKPPPPSPERRRNHKTPNFARARTISLLKLTEPHYRAPSRLLLGRVKIPMLLLHARDDPLVSHDDCVDWADAVKNSRIIAVRTHRGGHCGWHENLLPIGPSWAVHLTTDYISAVIEQTHQTGWLCAVFDALGRVPGAVPLASRIAHAAASHDIVVPPVDKPSFSAFHSFLFDDADARSSRANSVVGDQPSLDDLAGGSADLRGVAPGGAIFDEDLVEDSDDTNDDDDLEDTLDF